MSETAGVEVPVIDIEPLRSSAPEDPAYRRTAALIDQSCRQVGFFSIVGHGVDMGSVDRLEQLGREFLALDVAEKERIAMTRGGRAWRGWFPLEGELTSGRPDQKEGIYFGQELGSDDPRVQAGLPLHGANLFPERPVALRAAVLEHIAAMTELGHVLVAAIAVGLGLPADWFRRHLTDDPLVLFRIFRYPPVDLTGAHWGVGEHTDYGLLTILRQDATGGLEVRHPADPSRWIAVAPQPDAFVVNLGDMLDKMTAGRYRSTAHRVRATPHDRVSMPFFFDPAWNAHVLPLPLPDPAPGDDAHDRWDGTSVHQWTGTYGDYLVLKLGKVFPELGSAVLP